MGYRKMLLLSLDFLMVGIFKSQVLGQSILMRPDIYEDTVKKGGIFYLT